MPPQDPAAAFDRIAGGRRMTRSFLPEPIPMGLVDDLVDLARRAPSAGNAQALDVLVLGARDVAAYWDTTLPGEARRAFPWPGLLHAPVLVIPWVDPAGYAARYAEPDKARTGLGSGPAAWPVPYWWVDGGMMAMSLLLAAEAHGLGALFFGLFEHEEAVRERFEVPAGRRAVGTIALGRPDGDDRASRSAGRGRRPRSEAIHHGRWHTPS